MYLQLFQPSFNSIYKKKDWSHTKYPPWCTNKDSLVLIKKLEFLLFYQTEGKNFSLDSQRAKKKKKKSHNRKKLCSTGLIWGYIKYKEEYQILLSKYFKKIEASMKMHKISSK